jgi:hypothetical protein
MTPQSQNAFCLKLYDDGHGAKLILDEIQPGDLALLLVLSDREAVFEALKKDQK